MPLREITEPVDLCLPNGRLNPAALGRTRTPLHRTPLHRTPLRGWGRTKCWEYWGIVTPDWFVGLTVSSLDYAAVPSIYLVNRATGEHRTIGGLVLFARGTSIRGTAPDFAIDVTSPDAGDALGVVVHRRRARRCDS